MGIEVLLGLAVLVSAAILSTTPAARVEPVRLTAYLRDGQIDPPVLEVPRNRLVRLVVINEGTSRHAFVAYQFPHDMEGRDHQHGDAADMVVVAEPGTQEVLLFTARREGEYHVYCAIDDHQYRGETARLIVR